MIRREETVVALMERESIRNAEIEKMKDITGIRGEEQEYGINMKEPSTSVLCIKCKKGLDDLSNIRAAILNKSDKAVIQCEGYRVLLPNLRGRRPNRSNEWLRKCMRNIMVSKMREDVVLMDIKGHSSKFSAYVYAWFARPIDNNSNDLKSLQAADEDRWGLYYGVKAMARDNDPEAVIFWTLLEERHGHDGMQFIFHCLSIVLSMGGPDLWKQFGDSLTSSSSSINPALGEKPEVRNHVWLDIRTAIEAVKCILVRALKPHVQEVVDAIYAFRVLPAVADPQILADNKQKSQENGTDEEKGEEGLGLDSVTAAGAEHANSETDAPPASQAEPTHLCIFVWLRLMMQQIQAEQIHRAAAVRLMCESASIGALTPQLQSISDKDDLGSQGAQVEYPQFSMIAKTLFPGISTLDTATLFHACYDEGRRKVTSDVLMKIADKTGLFAKSMKLTVLPLLSHEIREGKTFEELVEGLPRPSDESQVEPNDASEDGSVSSKVPEPIPASIPEAPEPNNSATTKLQLPSEMPPSNEQRLRTHLANLIHRKAAAILPDFELLVQRVPDRWKSLLLEARDGVVQALIYAVDKIKRDKLQSNDLRSPSGHFVDGIQPYVQYRRLLATMLLVKSYCDNPLLPSELFLGMDRTVLPSFEYSLKHVENLLSSLEAGFVTGLRLDKIDNPAQPITKVLIPTVRITEALAKRQFGSLGLSKVYRYEAVRRNLVARKIQGWYRAYFQGKAGNGGFHKVFYQADVPPSVRRYMRPGYLRGLRGLKQRKVSLPVWWAETQLSEVMAYKLNYDLTAARLGKASLSLGHAIVAYSLHLWSSVDAAERHVQDLMHCIREHSAYNARINLFAHMLGVYTRVAPRGETESEELLARETMDNDEAAKLLCSDVAVALYVNLLADVHREIAAVEQRTNEPLANTTTSTSLMQDIGFTVVNKGGLLAENANMSNPLLLPATTVTGAADSKASEPEIFSSAPKCIHSVKVLYPATYSPHDRADESAVWLQSADVLAAAGKRWAQHLRGLSIESICVFSDFAQVLKGVSKDITRRVNVDEYVWLCLKQWAQYTSYAIHRCASRAAYAIKNAPVPPVLNTPEPGNDVISAMYSEHTVAMTANTTKSLTETNAQPGPFTTLYLGNLIESICKIGDNQTSWAANPYASPVEFVKSLSENTLKAQSQACLLKMLRTLSVWDMLAKSAGGGRQPARQGWDSEPATVMAFGEVLSGASSSLVVDCLKSMINNYLPIIHQFIEHKGEEHKRRQKNKSKNISEPDNMTWDFSNVRKTLDNAKLALRSLEHIHNENSWSEKGPEILLEKLRQMMSGVQDVVTQTEVVRFSSYLAQSDASAGRLGPFPSDLSEAKKKVMPARPARDPLLLFQTPLSKLT